MPPMWGSNSEISVPHSPHFRNFANDLRALSSVFCSWASCCPSVNDVGKGWPSMRSSSGFGIERLDMGWPTRHAQMYDPLRLRREVREVRQRGPRSTRFSSRLRFRVTGQQRCQSERTDSRERIRQERSPRYVTLTVMPVCVHGSFSSHVRSHPIHRVFRGPNRMRVAGGRASASPQQRANGIPGAR